MMLAPHVFTDSRKAEGSAMQGPLKSRLAARRVLSEPVFGHAPNHGIELGLRLATGLLITFAMGMVLLVAEVRFSTPV